MYDVYALRVYQLIYLATEHLKFSPFLLVPLFLLDVLFSLFFFRPPPHRLTRFIFVLRVVRRNISFDDIESKNMLCFFFNCTSCFKEVLVVRRVAWVSFFVIIFFSVMSFFSRFNLAPSFLRRVYTLIRMILWSIRLQAALDRRGYYVDWPRSVSSRFALNSRSSLVQPSIFVSRTLFISLKL